MVKKQQQPIPIVRIVALLSFSFLTLLGVATGLSPAVILTRVSIGTGLIMLATWTGLKLFSLIAM